MRPSPEPVVTIDPSSAAAAVAVSEAVCMRLVELVYPAVDNRSAPFLGEEPKSGRSSLGPISILSIH